MHSREDLTITRGTSSAKGSKTVHFGGGAAGGGEDLRELEETLAAGYRALAATLAAVWDDYLLAIEEGRCWPTIPSDES